MDIGLDIGSSGLGSDLCQDGGASESGSGSVDLSSDDATLVPGYSVASSGTMVTEEDSRSSTISSSSTSSCGYSDPNPKSTGAAADIKTLEGLGSSLTEGVSSDTNTNTNGARRRSVRSCVSSNSKPNKQVKYN